jgi:arylsulfatase A-like enzyme
MPSESGVYAKYETLSHEDPVLAERLREDGFTTRGFSANANISDTFDFTRGFEEFHHSWRGERRHKGVVDWGSFISRTADMGPRRFVEAVRESLGADRTLKSLEIGLKMKARDLGIERIAGQDDGAQQAKDLVESTDFGDDEFLFLNLMEAHGPYKAPKSYRTIELDNNPSFEDTVFGGPEEETETIRRAYEDCVRYLSDVYEEIFATLSREFDYVITVSDHGEMFGKAGIWDHNFGIFPELAHVPLTIYDGSDGIRNEDATVSIKDIYPTVLALAGIGSGDLADPNILEADESTRQFIERFGIRTSRVEKLQNRDYDEDFIEKWDRHFLGVASGTDGYAWESHQGFKSNGEFTDSDSEALVREYKANLDPRSGRGMEDTVLPSDVAEQLEELGYM